MKRYEQESGAGVVEQIIVDREGMAAEFLAGLKEAGRTVISILRTDQYTGLNSFTDIGDFVPLHVSKHGNILREVAPASITLPLPEQKGQALQLRVALIRDLRRQVPVPPTQEEMDYPKRWDADLSWEERRWWEPGWQATPLPAPPTVPKLIPIVTTTVTIDAVSLAQTYTRRWPLQEKSAYCQGHYFTDFWAAYSAVIPSEHHTAVGKETRETAHVERWNNTLRQRLARFVRMTLSFSKSVVMHEACLLIFLHRYNREQAILFK